MARFQVDPELLGEAANRLEGYRSRLTELQTRSSVGDLGSGRLVSCAQETETRIVRRLDEATEAVAGMARVLREAGQTYRGTDDQIRACAAGTVTSSAQADR